MQNQEITKDSVQLNNTVRSVRKDNTYHKNDVVEQASNHNVGERPQTFKGDVQQPSPNP